MRRVLNFCLAFALLASGCSLDYTEGAEGDELLESVPDAVFNKFVHTAVKGDILVFQIEAEKASIFSKKKYTELAAVRFVEYDDDGAVSLEGRAQSARFYTETENAEIKGAIYCYSRDEKVAFFAETLLWNSENRLLESRTGEAVRIEKDDGSFIVGSYFSIDARRKVLNFEAPVYGTYFSDEDEETR